ncbi:MAG: type IV pilus modification PilV family protein [Actinomycetota bacterium]
MIKAFHHNVIEERGFTVIEVMAALVVFSLMTLGLVPLLTSSLKGSELSQSYTVGKNLALEAMERVRGLPYYISYSAQASRVDVLDLYYPQYAAGGSFTTVCDATTTAAPACPKRVPDGYSVTFDATFVTPGGDDLNQTYTPLTAPSTYRWDSDTTDLPPSQILEMVVTVVWTRAGQPKQSQLRTLLSDRKFGEVTVRGSGKIDYGIDVQTGYVDPTGASSLLTVTAGNSEALVESKTTSTANETVRAAELRLVEVPADPSAVGADIALVEGAKSIVHAPPNISPTDVSVGAQTLAHPRLDPVVNVAGIETTGVQNVDVSVTDELPSADGELQLGNSGSATDDLWVAPQVDTDRGDLLKLNTLRPMFIMHHSGSDVMSGSTGAVATDIAASDRKVETSAAVSLDAIRLLPTSFISSSETERAVVVIDSFDASVSCKSTADPLSAGATATWSATLRYWTDSTNDGVLNGSYATLNLSGADASDQLAEVRTLNPLVYDGLTANEDVYLFDDPANGKVGYLTNWGSLFSAGSTGVTEDAAGEVTTAAIDGALSINSAPTGTTADSALKVNLGKLSCEAVDSR